MKLYVKDTDISQFYDSVTWSGNKSSAARTLDFGVIVSGTDKNLPTLSIMMDDAVKLETDSGDVVCIGNVINKSKSIDNNIMSVTAIDKLIKANTTEVSYTFEEETPDSIASKVFGDIGLSVGHLESGSPITRQYDIETAYNVVYSAYKMENEKTDIPYMIRMNGENVEVVEQGKTVAQYTLEPSTNLINATYSEDGKNAISTVKMYDENGEEIGEVTGDFSAGGTTIYRQEKDEDAQARAEGLLKGIEKAASIKAFGDYDLITGNAVLIKEPFTGLIGKFYIVGDTHTFSNNYHTVELELSYDNIMDDISSSSSLSDDVSNLTGSTVGQKALSAGEKIVGTKYKWGGNSPSEGIDCSGFVQWSINQAGGNVPGRLTSSGLRSNPKSYGFVEVPFSERKPGDVLWQQGHVAFQHSGGKILESGGTTRHHMGYSGVGIVPERGRRFSKAYRYVGG